MNSLLIRRYILVFISAFLWTACCWSQPNGPDANRIQTRISQIELSRDGKYMALAMRRSQNGNSLGQDIQLWSFETGKMLWTAEGPGRDLERLCFSPDSSKVALSGMVVRDGEVSAKIWNTASGKQEMELVLERFQRVQSMDFSSDSKTLVATIYSSMMLEEKAEIKRFDIETGKTAQSLIAFDGSAYHLTHSADGSTLVAVLSHTIKSATQDVEVVFWNSSDYSIKQRVSMGKIIVNRFVLSPDATKAAVLGGKMVPNGMGSTTLTLWDIENQSFQPATVPDESKERVYFLKYAPDGNKLIVAGTASLKPARGEVWVLSGATGDVLRQLNADNIFGDKKYSGHPAALTSDGQAIAVAEGVSKRVDLLSLEDGSFIRTFE